MYKLELTQTAVKNIQEFNNAEQQLISKKLLYLEENFDALKSSKKITELKGTGYNHYRFVIARRIRAIFELQNDKLILLILKIGRRKDIYE
ncbi:Putative plasmid stabilization system [Sulfurovum sp. enrichment culture clone C5]|uniref:Putative plasmid stabilization system n=1 Tax=Sulfurovum sp. enrichment culture clone C5 TaxID=497650 RepID=A0A0S4XMY8_9BACT|nr:Putative plasmid stabilization system [Sulfurovum sp. enrichment culture clone C5]